MQAKLRIRFFDFDFQFTRESVKRKAEELVRKHLREIKAVEEFLKRVDEPPAGVLCVAYANEVLEYDELTGVSYHLFIMSMKVGDGVVHTIYVLAQSEDIECSEEIPIAEFSLGG